jgi:hypothetical protein
MNECKEVYDALIAAAPTIPDSILTLYNTKFKDTGIGKPEIANGIEHIQIHSENGDEKNTMKKMVMKYKNDIEPEHQNGKVEKV